MFRMALWNYTTLTDVAQAPQVMSHDGSTAADITRPTRPSPVRTPGSAWCTPPNWRSASNHIGSLGLDSTDSEPGGPSRLSDLCIGRTHARTCRDPHAEARAYR